MLESEGISRRHVKPSKPTNNFADGMFKTVECNDKAMQRKTFACLQNMDLVSSNACNTFFTFTCNGLILSSHTTAYKIHTKNCKQNTWRTP